MDCIFCKIAAGEIPAKVVYEDEFCLAFHDVAPQTPVHVLVIPKQHIPSAAHVAEEHAEVASKLLLAVPKVAGLLSLEDGFRVVTNVGENGGQTVHHLHFHLMGGKKLAAVMG
ncbi:MAG TPA: histidine triad nucleotide-binding protein [Clostridiales bacterium]|jgi:histidine triad (HIT) family protein|nr:histidine triad nucleotide-binding protein [Clostridiales bacterium]